MSKEKKKNEMKNTEMQKQNLTQSNRQLENSIGQVGQTAQTWKNVAQPFINSPTYPNASPTTNKKLGEAMALISGIENYQK